MILKSKIATRVIPRIFIIQLIVMLASCTQEQKIESYDDCILAYIKPSMTLEATETVKLSCTRKFNTSVAIPTIQTTQTIGQSKREQCLANVESEKNAIILKLTKSHYGFCRQSNLNLHQSRECAEFSKAIDQLQRDGEDRCIKLYPY